MPLCAGCGSSYSDDFKFCPHCGRATPESTRVLIEVHSAPIQFEEGVLRLVYTGKSEDQLVDRGKRGLFGVGWKDAQINVFFFVFDLKVYHQSRQHYVGLVSDPFRGAFYEHSAHELRMLATACEYEHHTSKWYEKYQKELTDIWGHFNDRLIENGWNGITQDAIKRQLPEFLDRGGVIANASGNVFTDAERWSARPPNESKAVEVSGYRYRRTVDS